MRELARARLEQVVGERLGLVVLQRVARRCASPRRSSRARPPKTATPFRTVRRSRLSDMSIPSELRTVGQSSRELFTKFAMISHSRALVASDAAKSQIGRSAPRGARLGLVARRRPARPRLAPIVGARGAASRNPAKRGSAAASSRRNRRCRWRSALRRRASSDARQFARSFRR